MCFSVHLVHMAMLYTFKPTSYSSMLQSMEITFIVYWEIFIRPNAIKNPNKREIPKKWLICQNELVG